MQQSRTPRVSVVIPNWNGAKLLPVVLDSLRTQTLADFETVVVDNGSSDESCSLLEREYPEVRLVRLPQNLGFSVAVNAGIRASRTELVALINNDIELEPEWMARVVAALDADPSAGFAATRIRSYWRRDHIDSAGDDIRGLPTGRGHGEPDGPEFDEPTYVPSACAAACVYRRSMLDDVGLFHEPLWAYSEDVELGLRAQVAGYKCRYVPDAISYHMGSTTSKRVSSFAAFLQLRNSFSVYFTALPREYILRCLPWVVRHNVWFALYAGGPRLLARVAWALVRAVPAMRRRRREIFARRRVSDAELMAMMLMPKRFSLRTLRDKLAVLAGRRQLVETLGRVAPSDAASRP